jgi:hypothetical protein
MDRVPDAIGFNIKLSTLRSHMLSLRATALEAQIQQRPLIRVAPVPDLWQPMASDSAHSYNDIAPRPGRRLSEVVGGVGPGGSFVCPGCKRVLALSKKYAKEQCQTCYKKEKRLRAEEALTTPLFRA